MPAKLKLTGMSYVVAALFAVAGCKGIGIGPPTDAANGSGSPDHWSFTMATSKNNFTVAGATTDTSIITITRAGGFTGPVVLSAMIPPPGLGFTVTFEDITTTGVVTTARMMVAVPGSATGATGIGFGVVGKPTADVTEQNFLVTFDIVRKTGTFINAPATLSVGRGQSIQQLIGIIRTNYTAAVPFTLFNAPAGVTATFSPNPTLDLSTQMTLTAASTVAEGSYSIGVRANEGTTFQGTAPVTLTVTAPGSIAIGLNVSTLITPKGSVVPIGVNITRANYTGPVTFAVSGVPPGVNTAFVNPAVGNSFSISFAATNAAVAGNYPVTITAGGPGLTDVSTILTISIPP